MTGLLRRVLIALAIGVAAVPTVPAVAQDPSTPPTVATVQQVFEGRESWVGRYVQITGKVARWDRSNSFILEDNFGGGIEVYVVGPLPKREAEVVVKGMVAVDGMRNPYLNALSVAVPTTTPPGGGDTVTPPPAPPANKSFIASLKENPTILIVVAGVIILGVGLFFALRKPAAPAVAPMGMPMGGAGMPTGMPNGMPMAMSAPAGVDEGKTIRIARPDESQGTLQILPGRLEICSGQDAGKVADIRFVRDRTGGGPIPEVTFGRHGQASPTHVVLKSPTVSRLHAKFRFEAGRWSVLNYSETNPVQVNKRPLSTTDSPVLLSDQDVIEMGEVGFRYHA